ncbi:MAG: hypothetical protein ACRD40_07210 [Candidatus Acidiferrales bacterium]
MAIQSAVIDFIAAGDVCRFEPVAVVLLDIVTIRLTADGTFSCVGSMCS